MIDLPKWPCNYPQPQEQVQKGAVGDSSYIPKMYKKISSINQGLVTSKKIKSLDVDMQGLLKGLDSYINNINDPNHMKNFYINVDNKNVQEYVKIVSSQDIEEF